MSKFKFRSNQTIGAAPAELDNYYLNQCFIDTGDLDILCDCEDPRRLLVGRTGAGKSALMLQLQKVKENVILIRPESLALTYISNSNILNFFLEAGVKMDIFYRLLWRHIFVVEILKARFHIYNESKKSSFLDQIWSLVPKKKQHELALDYLKKWGGKFWEETEYRIHEVTSTLERQLEAAAQGTVPNIVGLSASAAKKLTEEQKAEVVHRGQEIVKGIQIRELSTVMDFLGDVLLTDKHRKYYIAIDKLDDDWVEDQLRFRLIRALIETSLDFARIQNVKIIVALRNDLLDRVFRYTRDAGFQEEKFRTSMLQVAWTQENLTEILDSLIGVLVKELYTDKVVTYDYFLPDKIGKQKTIDYLLRRTHMRPRDIIQFFNACIVQADGKAAITPKILLEAEGTYSRERLRALADEWFGLYPNLMHQVKLLRGAKEVFRIGDRSLAEFEENALSLLVSGQGIVGLDLQYMNLYVDGGVTLEDYRELVIQIFYKVGIVGLKNADEMGISWSDSFGQSVSRAEIAPDTRVYIHRAYWRTLGILGHTQKDDVQAS